ncbi:MAG: hypothetical protein MRZ74_08320 [Blautia sp.]|nr:hypothetical protein [Blautia sp.]
MKWKLDGNTVIITFDKDTKFLKQIGKAKKKDDPANQNGRDEKTVQNPGEKNLDAGTDAGKMDYETIKLEDMKEGAVVSVKVKENGSLVAAEVLVLADIQEHNSGI